MTEAGMFFTTLAAGAGFLVLAKLPLDKPIGNALLRAGLWMNGIDRWERDEIMTWRQRRAEGAERRQEEADGRRSGR